MKEQVLVASRRAIAWHATGAGALMAASLFVVVLPADFSTPSFALDGIAGVLLFGAALIASLVRLARPYRLVVGKDALVVERSFRQPRRIAWADVQEFFVSGDGKRPRIAIRYDRAHGLTGLTMGGSFGTEDALPVGEFDMSAYAIAQLLNDARREGVEAAPISATIASAPQQQIVS